MFYSAGITKATTHQPTFCVDLDVLLEILEQNRLKHVISPILVIFDFLEQNVLGKKKLLCACSALQKPSNKCLAHIRELLMPKHNDCLGI
jgi:hypothetical protein